MKNKIELNSEEIKQIKSYSKLKDISECVLQLIYNSIDASSNLILVSIDFSSFSCTIHDNGVGIAKADLKLIGERYLNVKAFNSKNCQFFKSCLLFMLL